ncbi:MAG: hypothetical protein LBF16_12360 [Pseudomonadales bacterium]|jgi:hypothetical protein|nr:hypothetical protein [Pseudomonadales bacterium]
MILRHTLRLVCAALFLPLLLSSCSDDAPCGKGIGTIKDEALCVGRTAASFPSADEDYFADMDYGISKDPAELQQRLLPYAPGITEEQAVDAFAKGRNNWIVWTAGNDKMWDELSRTTFGNVDFLKIVTNHPSLKFSRDNRWFYLGLVNEPCYSKGDAPRTDRFGLYMDVRDPDCGVDPFENEQKYPGVAIGARGKNIPAGSFYGYGTGIMGLRLFPNPAFDAAAQAKWDPERFYTDPSYYNNRDLIRPYRVGMSCGFCHIGPNPSNPPLDPEHPTWANLNSNPGAQYFWVDRIFMYKPDASNFAWQLFHTSRPGALDTSFISPDNINNPRTMNAIYNLPGRMEMAAKWGREKLANGSLNNNQFNSLPAIPADSPLRDFFSAPDTVQAPRVLKDGADSVGVLGALNRVYVNIGLFSEEWMQHFTPLIGGKDVTPFRIDVARANSSYWNANEAQTPDLALFFLGSARPDLLANAPDGAAYLSQDAAQLQRGKEMFAENCARCHSSKLPEPAFTDFFPDGGCVNANYLNCWNDYFTWTNTDEFKTAMTAIVKAPDFLDGNFLSTDLRIPVTLLETNLCSPLASNGLRGNIWDNFSSETYKSLPSVGSAIVQNPFTGAVREITLPGGGRGFTRPASLVSLWSTAPFFVNNALGDFKASGSVADRLASFDNAIEQLLWPERRQGDFTVVTRSGRSHPGHIDVTSEQTYLRVAKGYLPDFLSPLQGVLDRLLPWLFRDGGVEIGPIPSGTPINLISNIDVEQRAQALLLLVKIKKALKALPAGATDEQARATFAPLVEPLLDISKCSDFVVNKGHYFGTDYQVNGTGLSDDDKLALIAFLKTF